MTKPTEAQAALFRSLGDYAKRLERTLEGYWSGEMPVVEAQKNPESFIHCHVAPDNVEIWIYEDAVSFRLRGKERVLESTPPGSVELVQDEAMKHLERLLRSR